MIGTLGFALLLLTGQGKQPAPEFYGKPSDWIQGQTTLKALRGHPVLVDFWDYTCVNCIRTFPYVKEWYRRYHPLGLEIIAVHTPEFPFEESPANVRAAVKRFGFKFPVLNDPKGVNWKDYSVEAWPTKWLLDADGQPIYRHEGESGYATTEKQIQAQILKIHPNAKLPPLMPALHDTDQAGAVCHPCTQEKYMNDRGVRDQDVGWTAADVGKTSTFSYPTKVEPDTVYLSGKWTPKHDYLVPAGSSDLLLDYRAKEVNMVLQPTSGPVSIEVFQDGKPLAAEDVGNDVHFARAFNHSAPGTTQQPKTAILTVDTPRMYSLVKNHVWGRHKLELKLSKPGVHLYTFSFSTDCAYLPKRAGDRRARG